MTRRAHVIFALGAAMIILIIGAAFLVGPASRRTQELRDDIRRLHESAMVSPSVTGNLEGLAREYQRIQHERSEIVRRIPPYPDLDGLGDAIARSLERQGVFAPTVRTGAPATAAPGTRLSEQVLPILVDMDAPLTSILDLLDEVESVGSLVRVVSVRAEADRLGDATSDPPMLTATIGLEIVFDPPSAGEGL